MMTCRRSNGVPLGERGAHKRTTENEDGAELVQPLSIRPIRVLEGKNTRQTLSLEPQKLGSV